MCNCGANSFNKEEQKKAYALELAMTFIKEFNNAKSNIGNGPWIPGEGQLEKMADTYYRYVFGELVGGLNV